jgi:hypothetical protein
MLTDAQGIDSPVDLSIFWMVSFFFDHFVLYRFHWKGNFKVIKIYFLKMYHNLKNSIFKGIYKGNPSAPANSTAFASYNEGVKMGCWCLLAYSLISAIYAGNFFFTQPNHNWTIVLINHSKKLFFLLKVMMEKYLIDIFSTRTLYFFSNFVYAVCVGLIYFFDNVWIIMPLFATSGVLLTANTTLPYTMLSDYHQDKAYRNKSASGTKRGLGLLKNLIIM